MRTGYYRAAARSAGVPTLWLEDAAQDIAIEAWRAGEDTPTIVYRAAVDCARRYGPRTRRGHLKPLFVQLEAAAGLAVDDDWRDAWRVIVETWPILSPRQRHALRRRVNGRPMSSLQSGHASAARRRLRAALAA